MQDQLKHLDELATDRTKWMRDEYWPVSMHATVGDVRLRVNETEIGAMWCLSSADGTEMLHPWSAASSVVDAMRHVTAYTRAYLQQHITQD